MNLKIYWYPRPNKNETVTIYGYLKLDKQKSSPFNSGVQCLPNEFKKGKFKNSPAKTNTLSVIEEQIRGQL